MTAASVGKDVKANRNTRVTSRTYLGNRVSFNGMQIRGQGKVVIGSYFHSGWDCLILTSTHNYDGGSCIPYGPGNEDIHKDVKIADFVWLGDRVTVLGGVEIGEGVIVQAGSVVTSDIPPLAIAGGHPAKVFKYRNEKHYNMLKAQGKFF
jgi:acetyltransferase-like isoleucine patch superfamily enzyme